MCCECRPDDQEYGHRIWPGLVKVERVEHGLFAIILKMVAGQFHHICADVGKQFHITLV